MIPFKRNIEENIKKLLFKKNMIVILGPRQAGKTTLTKKIISEYKEEGEYFDCQIADVRKCFELGRPDLLFELTKGKKIVAFDEAQTVQDIGAILKVFHDTYPEIQVIATGSSSFDLSNKINEPMTGRIFEFILLPLSLDEISKNKEITREDLNQYMVYGTYPAVVGAESEIERIAVLRNLATNYLYKDIFIFESIRNPRIFEQLVIMLAHQIGSIVSINELSLSLGISRPVVLKYLRLLEQSFIIKIVYTYSNNARKELKKAFKVFFYDNGVRNALVSIDPDIEKRADKGALFENFFIGERIKNSTLNFIPTEIMFWRNRAGFEIDVIERVQTKITGFECKWKDENVVFTQFLKEYPHTEVSVVTPENYIKKLSNQG